MSPKPGFCATAWFLALAGGLLAGLAAADGMQRLLDRKLGTVCTDERGGLMSSPASRTEGAAQAAMLGTVAAVGASGVVLVGARLLRGWLNRWRLRAWDVEWERVDTRWGGKTG